VFFLIRSLSFTLRQEKETQLTDFRQTFVTGASRDRDDLITFLGQKVKVQGHAIPGLLAFVLN